MGILIDLTGQVINHLTVIRYAGTCMVTGGSSQRQWECRCVCGETCLFTTTKLTGGWAKHCPKCDPEMIGKTFYYLTIRRLVGVWRAPERNRSEREWECECLCGERCIVRTCALRSGRTRHCPACQPEVEALMYLKNYRAYREAFTAEQRERYESYVRGRKGTRLEAEAVDVTLRELPPQPAVHISILGDKAPARLLIEHDAEEDMGAAEPKLDSV